MINSVEINERQGQHPHKDNAKVVKDQFPFITTSSKCRY